MNYPRRGLQMGPPMPEVRQGACCRLPPDNGAPLVVASRLRDKRLQ
jgi:hypothetical protein